MTSTECPQVSISIIQIPDPKPCIIQMSRRKKIRNYFRGYCQRSSIHGLQYLAEKRSMCERLLWAMLIITSVAACGYMISRIYSKYVEGPVIVSFATKESHIFTIPFPAVTICPMSKSDRNKFNFSKFIDMKLNKKAITAEDELNAQYFSLLCQRYLYLFPKNKTFTDEFFEKLNELQLPKVTLSFCWFMGKVTLCNYIFKPIILDEGLCYNFNMMDRDDIFKDNVVHYSNYHKGDTSSSWSIDDGYASDSAVDTFPRRALLSGADNSLEILFYHEKINTDYLCVDDVQGYSVALHTPHSIPLLKKQYFQVPLDTSVVAAIQPKMMTTSKEVKKYDSMDRECYFTSERPLQFFKIYTPENCRLECLTNHTLERCGCVNFFMPRENTTFICGNGNVDCMKDAERQLKIKEVNNLVNKSYSEKYCNCMPLCTELSYDIEQSQSEWYWPRQFQAQQRKSSEAWQLTTQHSRLSIFFKSEHFLTLQRNELYGPIDFLASFGGLLGLFTGFSLLSLVEIIYFLTVRLICNTRQDKTWTGSE